MKTLTNKAAFLVLFPVATNTQINSAAFITFVKHCNVCTHESPLQYNSIIPLKIVLPSPISQRVIRSGAPYYIGSTATSINPFPTLQGETLNQTVMAKTSQEMTFTAHS